MDLKSEKIRDIKRINLADVVERYDLWIIKRLKDYCRF